jgi:hypothetical protein
MKLIHLAVRIAGDVAEHRVVRGRLIQPVDRHDGKKLLDRPAIGHALEQRKITEVGIGQHRVEVFQLLGLFVHVLEHPENLVADHPEQILGLAALIERQIAEAE